jgi:hypothetical protein
MTFQDVLHALSFGDSANASCLSKQEIQEWRWLFFISFYWHRDYSTKKSGRVLLSHGMAPSPPLKGLNHEINIFKGL